MSYFSSSANNSYEIFDLANSQYESQKYDSAKSNYSLLYQNGIISKELFLNLGNSFFKLDSLPNAILFYEKGLKIAPGDIDLTHNLQYCNTLLKDKNAIKKSILISEVYQRKLMIKRIMIIVLLFYQNQYLYQ